MNREKEDKQSPFHSWWTTDFWPLDGRVRFIFYLGILLLCFCVRKSPILGIGLYKFMAPELFKSYGLIKLLGIPYLSVGLLTTVIWICKGSLVFAAFGLFSRFSAIIAALSFTFLHGIFMGSNAINNAWYVPMYALICLCFARSNDPWSLDYLLKKRFGKTEEKREGGSLLDTGFAIKFFFVLMVWFYFASGRSKLWFAGMAWFDGESLRTVFLGSDVPLALWLQKSDFIMVSGSVVTIVVECGGVLAVFIKSLRIPFIISILFFHQSIRYLLEPWYYANCFCMILFIDWHEVVGFGRYLFFRLKGRAIAEDKGSRMSVSLCRPSRLGAVSLYFATIMSLFAMHAAVIGIPWWPFSNTPMFSSYNAPGIVAGVPEEHYWTEPEVQRLASTIYKANYDRHRTRYLVERVHLETVSETGDVDRLYIGVGVPTPKHWTRVVLGSIVIEDFASRPDGKLEVSADEATRLPLGQFLLKILPLFERYYSDVDEIESVRFIYRLKDRDVVLVQMKYSN